MIADDLDAAASRAAGRYDLLLNGILGAYHYAFQNADVLTPMASRRLEAQAHAMGQTHLDGETQAAAVATLQIAQQARVTTLGELGAETDDTLSEALRDQLDAAQTFLTSEIGAQIDRDVAFVKRSLRNAGLQVLLAANAQGISPRAAMIQYRAKNGDDPKFAFRDRTYRALASQTLAAGAWRHHLLGAYNDTVLSSGIL